MQERTPLQVRRPKGLRADMFHSDPGHRIEEACAPLNVSDLDVVKEPVTSSSSGKCLKRWASWTPGVVTKVGKVLRGSWTSENRWRRIRNEARAEEQRFEHDMFGYLPVPVKEPEHDCDFSVVNESLLCSSSPLRHCLRTLLDSVAFQTTTMVVILVNAVVIGFETDMPALPVWAIAENAFLFFFSVELGLRMVVAGPALFFCGKYGQSKEEVTRISVGRSARRQAFHDGSEVFQTMAWNVFDFMIVAIGILSLVAENLNVRSSRMTGDATLFRSFRLLRMFRVLRVIRIIRFLKQLYLLAYGFMEGIMAVFWVAVMTAAVIYMCSIVLVRLYGRPGDEDEHHDFFIEHFGSISRSMVTLFDVLCAPTLQPFRGIVYDYPLLVVFLVIFIVLGSFGISGLLTGVITESIIDKNQARVEEQRNVREAKRRLLEQKSGEFFDSLDTEKEGSLGIADIMLHSDELAHMFSVVGVACASYEMEQLFSIMDPKDTGQAERSQFVYSMVEFCEEVRPMSIMELNAQMSKCSLRVEACDSKLSQLLRNKSGLELGAQVAPRPPSPKQTFASPVASHPMVKLIAQIRCLTDNCRSDVVNEDAFDKCKRYEGLIRDIENLALDALIAVNLPGEAGRLAADVLSASAEIPLAIHSVDGATSESTSAPTPTWLEDHLRHFPAQRVVPKRDGGLLPTPE